MNSTAKRHRMIALTIGAALASTALAGCTAKSAPPASVSASKAQASLAKGKVTKAIANAEAAVMAEPRNAGYRAMMGAAYMEAGRFQSAATSFDDAMTLGDTSPRTALSLALAQIAAGENAKAKAVLNDWQKAIDPVDLGLAVALAGDVNQGVIILRDVIRSGSDTPKSRQNLAYAFALQGNWAAARVMAAADVPADKLDERIAQWASVARPEQQNERVAQLLQVPVSRDAGQPHYLALKNTMGAQQLAAEAASQVAEPDMAAAFGGELPAVGAPSAAAPESIVMGDAPASPMPLPPLAAREDAPAVVAASAPVAAEPKTFQDAFATPAPQGATVPQIAESAIKFISNPVVQQIPGLNSAAPIASRTVRSSADGKHLVQLGSFSSEDSARRAWSIYSSKYSDLDQYDMVITKAVVRGKTYYRVSAGGLALSDARSMCGRVKATGDGCIAWSEGKPLPGAVDTGVRMASR